jgi:hypothetical protein
MMDKRLRQPEADGPYPVSIEVMDDYGRSAMERYLKSHSQAELEENDGDKSQHVVP